ncbi:MAG: SDR family oxidoreductase [Gammaproteobacteria bacterium]|nr:SDR family oxidoreductase [Gammaproteobacteria bacterium]
MTKTVVITGANRGIGLEFVRQYLADGCKVVAGCRDPERATTLTGLANESDGRLQVIKLDVTDSASIAGLVDSLDGQSVDLLINNAGVYGPKGAGIGALATEAWLDVFATNSIAPVQLTGALLPNLKASGGARVVGISSRMGSIADNTSGGAYVYRSSKAALNAAFASAAIDLREHGVCIGILHPGWVETDMGGANALIDTSTSVTGMRRVIANLDMAKTGGFFSYDGSVIPW